MNTRSAALAADLILDETAVGRKRAKREAKKTLPLHTPWHARILGGLRSKPMYQGIDEDDDQKRDAVAKRRAKNKVARRSRRLNRSH